jgi:hypothetical protein
MKVTHCPDIFPARHRLRSKCQYLEDAVNAAEATAGTGLKPIVSACRRNLVTAKALLDKFIPRANAAWSYLHRIDEDLLLLMPEAQLQSRAIDIKCAVELNIAAGAVREAWIGDHGRLRQAIEKLLDGKGDLTLPEIREILREALRTANEQIDRGFWALSMNTRIAAGSGLLLGAAMLLALFPQWLGICWLNSLAGNLSLIMVLGLIGSYVSNLLTRSNFLLIRGGAFWIFVLYHLVVRPILGSFAAVFIYFLEKARLLFSLVDSGAAAASLLLSTSEGNRQATYLYLILAVVSGFAAEKLLRSMMDRILKLLEEKAEKTKQNPGSSASG